MKREKSGNTALAAGIAALAAIVIGQSAVANTYPGARFSANAQVRLLATKVKQGEMTLKELIEELVAIKGVKGVVVMENRSDLLVTCDQYKVKKPQADYEAVILVRANNKSLFSHVGDAFTRPSQAISGGGKYYCL